MTAVPQIQAGLPPQAAAPAPSQAAQEDASFFEEVFDAINPFSEGDEGLGFFDFLDLINPLQHIPIVSSIYRSITGDEIKPAMRIAGGGILGGPIGAAVSLANVMFEQATGDDVMGHVASLFEAEEHGPLDAGPDTAVAQLAPRPDAERIAAAHELAMQAREMAPPPPQALAGAEALPPLSVDMAAGPSSPEPADEVAQAALLDPRTLPPEPPARAAIDQAAAYRSNQIPRELLEHLYRMHQEQAQGAIATQTDRLF